MHFCNASIQQSGGLQVQGYPELHNGICLKSKIARQNNKQKLVCKNKFVMNEFVEAK